VLGTPKDQPIKFQLALLNGNLLLDTIPLDGWIELNLDQPG